MIVNSVLLPVQQQQNQEKHQKQGDCGSTNLAKLRKVEARSGLQNETVSHPLYCHKLGNRKYKYVIISNNNMLYLFSTFCVFSCRRISLFVSLHGKKMLEKNDGLPPGRLLISSNLRWRVVTRVPLKRSRKDFRGLRASVRVSMSTCVRARARNTSVLHSLKPLRKGLIIFKSLTRQRNPNNCLF